MNPLIPIGSTLIETCPNCKVPVKGQVDSKHHAYFTCPTCGWKKDYHIMGDGRGSRFTADDLKALLSRNPALKASDPFKRKDLDKPIV